MSFTTYFCFAVREGRKGIKQKHVLSLFVCRGVLCSCYIRMVWSVSFLPHGNGYGYGYGAIYSIAVVVPFRY